MNGNEESVISGGGSNAQSPTGEPNVDEEDEYDPDGLYGSDHEDDPSPSTRIPDGVTGYDGTGLEKDDDAMSLDGNSDVTVETPPRPPEMGMPPPGLATVLGT